MKMLAGKKKLKLYLWSAFAFYLFYSIAESLAYPETFFSRIINSFFLISYTTVLNFILFEFALPLFKLKWKRFVLGLLLIGLLIILYSFGLYGWRYFWIQLHIYTDFTPNLKFLEGVVNHSPFSFFSILFFGIARHIHDYIKLKNAAKQLQIEKQEAELNFLKSQTNPHFLFNTLNNIYSLARDKSDLAPESIMRLSKILRFMLYDTNGEYITIEQELKIIEDYIALEKLRYDDSLRISFKQTIDNSGQPIPPLLLIPLVENAFKHGVSETRENPFIDIQLTIYQQQLFFVVKNSAEEFSPQRQVKKNIGLSNLRRQLELLYSDYYLSAQQHEPILTASFLSAPKEEPFFITTLKINLASHV